MTPARSPGWWVRLGFGVDDEVAVADWLMADGECENAAEDEASVA